MQVSDFHFDLPDELIARYPMAERTASRLLQLDGQSGALRHGQFVDVLDQLNPGDLLVFNNTRVIPARMFGQKASGEGIPLEALQTLAVEGEFDGRGAVDQPAALGETRAHFVTFPSGCQPGRRAWIFAMMSAGGSETCAG